MDEQELMFPTKGVDLSLEFDRQPGGTTVYARNVRTQDPLDFRDRGGSRPGLSKYVAAAPGASPPPPPPGDPHTILTATDSGTGIVRFTTQAPHGLGGGELVTVTGCSVSSYNAAGLHVDGTPTPSTWETGDLPYVSDGTGGTWA